MKFLSKLTPSRRWLFLPPIAIGVAVVALLASSKKDLPRVELHEAATPLKVVLVKREAVQAKAVGYGTAKPRRLWSAVAEVSGRIVETHPNLRSGVAVKRGEQLLLIDPADYQLRVNQHAAELAQAKAQLEQTKLMEVADQRSLAIQQELLKVRQADYDRLQALNQRSAASRSESNSARALLLQQSQTVQTLKNTLTTYAAQISAGEAAVALALARLTEGQRDIERTKIAAPFDGLLSGVTQEPDQFVAPNQQLFQVHDIEFVEIAAQFSLAQLGQVLDPAPDVPASKITTRNPAADRGSTPQEYLPEQFTDVTEMTRLSASVITRSGDRSTRYTGQPVRMTESLDERTRTLGIVVRVRNRSPGERRKISTLRPGTYCEVTLTPQRPTMAHLVPRSSVEQGSVYVVDKDNRLRRRAVQIAFPLREHVAVVAGLFDDEMVVVRPPQVVIDGQLVEPQVAHRGDTSFVSSLPEGRAANAEDEK